jgi:SAM-dependent methyltransferase
MPDLLASLCWLAILAVLVWDLFRVRQKVHGLPVVPPTTDPAAGQRYEVLVAPGVEIPEERLNAAKAFASVRDLEVVDLLPARLDPHYAWIFGALVDIERILAERGAPPQTAAFATVVRRDVLERAGGAAGRGRLDEHVHRVNEAMRCAAKRGFAVLPRTEQLGPGPYQDRGVMRAALGSDAAVLYAFPVALLIIFAGFFYAPWTALACLLVFHAQQPAAFAGTMFELRDGLRHAALRLPLEVGRWWDLLQQREPIEAEAARMEATRPIYERLLAEGTERFFEPARETCPLCDSQALTDYVVSGDLLQHKPGRFVLQKCGGCGHIFQNPMLNPDGLSFYYRDVYDGLGAETTRQLFESPANPYVARAQTVLDVAERAPTAWLDVGCGHGHFCAAARSLLPDARFDGLDMSSSVDDAHRRGWIDTAHRGLFPEVAMELTGYDVVSMSHYLEHTLDPRAEIRAARAVLRDGGLLFIEVPEPESPYADRFRQFWVPWLQPQHLHFLSKSNLEQQLRAFGFEPLRWMQTEATFPFDYGGAAFFFFKQFAPSVGMPWRPIDPPSARWRNRAVWLAGIPVITFAFVLDAIFAPFNKKKGVSNSYRLVARKGEIVPRKVAEEQARKAAAEDAILFDEPSEPPATAADQPAEAADPTDGDPAG